MTEISTPNNSIDIVNNIEYRYSKAEFRADEKEHTFTDAERISCNVFFECLNVYKSIESGSKQTPIWNFTIPDPDSEEPFTIQVEHKEVYNPRNIQREFDAIGFTGFPTVFAKKGKGFLWADFMRYVFGKFRKPSVVELDAIDYEAETLLIAICKLFIHDVDSWYSGKAGICAALAIRENKECLVVKGADIAEILKNNKITRDPAQISKKLNEKGLKLLKTWQKTAGGLRAWCFPVEGLLPFGFSTDRAKKVETNYETVNNIEDIFSTGEKKPLKVDIVDGRTGERRDVL